MSHPDAVPATDERDESNTTEWTRRAALTALGAGAVAGLGAPVNANSHDAAVWSSGGTWYADAHGSGVYAGGDMLDAIQAAVDGLTPGRTTKETVAVENGGTVGPTSEVHAVDLPSYTTLDVRGPITIEDTGDELAVTHRPRGATGTLLRSTGDNRRGSADHRSYRLCERGRDRHWRKRLRTPPNGTAVRA